MFEFDAARARAASAALIAGYASNYGVHCGRYIVAAGAFSSLCERGTHPKMLLDHEGPEIGEWQTLSADERGLAVAGRLWETPRSIEAIRLYNDGCLTGLSLGPKGAIWDTMRCGIKVLKEVNRIDEISLCGEPYDPAALITDFRRNEAGL